MTISSALRESLRDRIDDPRRADYYADVAYFCAKQLSDGATPVVGISGPQGSGKSTVAHAIVLAFEDVGKRVVSVSIDDFYLTRAEQVALAERHPGNRYLEVRGYPGTHDVELGCRVLDSLRSGASTVIPSYDKSAHGGRGDRSSASRVVDGAVDLVLFDGWMLGFTPLHPSPGPLEVPNAALERYRAWNDRLDAFVWLEAKANDLIVDWRVDSERARRARGETALTEEEAHDYIVRFLPAYELYVPRLRENPPGQATLHVVLGADRLPT